MEPVKERWQVLEFIEENFELVKGKIDRYNSLGTIIVRKR